MYLPKSVVVETLNTAEEGSTDAPWYIAFDYINSDWADSPVWRSAMKGVGEPFKFSARIDGEIEELVESCGLNVVEHLHNRKELESRYVPKQTEGKRVGILGKYGGFVMAGSNG